MGVAPHHSRDLSGITAVILAGGRGTRLQSVLNGGQKVVAPVAGRPFLAYLLESLDAAGVRKALLCTGFQANDVRDAIGDRFGQLQIAYAVEPEPLGTAGAIRNAFAQLEGDCALVLNGDSHCPCDYGALVRAHDEAQAAATILLTQVDDVAPYGAVEVDGGGRVTAFREKGAPGSGWVNAGVYVLSRDFIAAIPENRSVSIETESFPLTVQKGIQVQGFKSDESFLDIGVPERYAAAEAQFGANARAEGSR